MPSVSPEDADAERTSLLASILDASTEYSIAATHLDGTILLWNEGARRIYGYDVSEVLGKNIRMLHDPGDVRSGKVDQIFAAALERGQWEGIVMRVRKGGASFATRIVLTVRRDPTGRPLGYLSISNDISAELRLNQRLMESEEYNRVLVESTVDGLLTTDGEGMVTDVNKQMELLTGVERERLIGTPFRDLIVPSSAADEAVRRTLEEVRVTDLELRLRQPTGGLREISYSATLFGEEPRGAGGVIATVRDVTEQKRLRERLEEQNRALQVQNQRVQEANRLKSEFLASMSHELRTPLNSIIGFSDFMLTAHDAPLTPPQREYLTDILSSGNHLLQLINGILDLAKVESGKLDLSPTSFVVQEAVDEVCSSLKPQVTERHLLLRTEVEPGVDRVVLDPLRFKQILFNLLSNAIKFTGDRGRVEVIVAPGGSSRFTLQVIDTGIGIPAKDLTRIFREFEQLDTGPGRSYPGTGLGLPLTRKLVERMGGTIAVHSEVDRGTTFTVRLPLVSSPLPSGEASLPPVRV